MPPLALGRILLVVVSVGAGSAARPPRAGTTGQAFAGAFVIERTEAGPVLERVALAEGETLALPRGEDTLAVVLPPSAPGLSGDLLQTGAGGAWVLRLADGRLSVGLAEGGRTRPVCDAALAELSGFDLLVSLVGAEGAHVWAIEGWSTAWPDEVAPPLDLFAGALPLGADDHVLTTAVRRRDVGSPLVGRSALRRVGSHLALAVLAPDGRPALLALDTAAATTVVTPRLVPAGTEVVPGVMVERSAAGTRLLDSVLKGATGDVGGVLGEARLERLAAEGLVLDDLRVTVLERMPVLGPDPIDGILGMDVLGRAAAVRISAPDAGREGALELLAEPPPADDPGVPLALVGGLPWTVGACAGARVHLLIDSGASVTVLPPAVARRLGVGEGDAAAPLQGLSGAAAAARRGALASLRIGARELGPLEVLVADVVPLGQLARGADAAVLGLPALERAGALVLDLRARRLRFEEPSAGAGQR